MTNVDDPAFLGHVPRFGAWADENHDAPVERQYFFRIRSAHDTSGEGAYTKNGRRPMTTAFEAFFKQREDDDWAPFDLHVQSPGYVMFAYSTAYCIWFFFAINAIERKVDFERLSLDCRIDATATFFVRSVSGEARVVVTGTQVPSAEDQAYIVERASVCPVARNIGGSFDESLTATFDVTGTS
jgi:hypothetical protein